ncbi:hypothetical protein RJ640_007354 [Escallonia rubra]|uniref:Reverse transcriptase Ty1/copia-type domain-containing protein n=1 Tax=Escallonia rubra TaxID=112253 RepID=A0AA88URV1_9ASTE|nr:hypothetical protein RJ640_007354 [Escallonia rubra]
MSHGDGETSSMEDKDLFLREPSMLVKTSPVQTKSTPEVELISRGDSEAEPIESFPNLSEELSRPINPTLTMPLKVYSRRIKPVINPVQVQETESSLGNEHSASGGVTALIVYVDDIIVTGNDSNEKEALRKYLAKEFEIKDLGKLKYFLGIEVARSKEGIFVSQQKYVLDLLEETVIWRSKKQPVVARSSSEAEFRSMAQDICELLWLKITLKDLKIKLETPKKLYCDNKSAINIAHNPVQYDRTKHVEVDRHFIKEKLERLEVGHVKVRARGLFNLLLRSPSGRISALISSPTIAAAALPESMVTCANAELLVVVAVTVASVRRSRHSFGCL